MTATTTAAAYVLALLAVLTACSFPTSEWVEHTANLWEPPNHQLPPPNVLHVLLFYTIENKSRQQTENVLVFNLLWSQLEASRSRTLWKQVCHSRLKAFLSWCRDDVPSDCRNFGSMIPFPFAVSPFSTTLIPLFFCVCYFYVWRGAWVTQSQPTTEWTQ